MFTEWMSEDSLNVDQYSLVSDEKDSIKHIYIVYLSCMYKFWRGEKKTNFTTNATWIYENMYIHSYAKN